MPFVSLLVVFFGVVAIIEEQHIFAPIINIVLGLPTAQQPAVTAARWFRPQFFVDMIALGDRCCQTCTDERTATGQVLYGVNGFLSMVSDNVFVATIFIESVADAYHEGYSDAANMTHAHFEDLAVAINMGTNLPSCATPNGQAAFLFILTSAVSSIHATANVPGERRPFAPSLTCHRTRRPDYLLTIETAEIQPRPHLLACVIGRCHRR